MFFLYPITCRRSFKDFQSGQKCVNSIQCVQYPCYPYSRWFFLQKKTFLFDHSTQYILAWFHDISLCASLTLSIFHSPSLGFVVNTRPFRCHTYFYSPVILNEHFISYCSWCIIFYALGLPLSLSLCLSLTHADFGPSPWQRTHRLRIISFLFFFFFASIKCVCEWACWKCFTHFIVILVYNSSSNNIV